uniref:Uncharacterized protein n=1 Tax=Kryptolebias marmoratus TaxID=37003 RepID=A0A3Q2ZKU9_KRYMA
MKLETRDMSSECEMNLRCPVCHNVFRDPVLLPCSHSFCDSCLQRRWRRDTLECPVCKGVSRCKRPPPNSALKKLCEAFLLERDQQEFCSLHSEELKLFCLEHQEPVCLVCRDSEKHADHRFRPIGEVAQDSREELRESLKPFQEKLKAFDKIQENYEETEKHIKDQARYAKKQIRKEFRRLREFLRAEEEARLDALKEEEKRKREAMKRKRMDLRREMTNLSDTIRATKEDLKAEDVSFLQNYVSAAARVQLNLLPRDPQPPAEPLLDEATHLGNLKFNIWTKMNDSCCPVILDPNTAHPGVRLSENLRCIKWGETEEVPDNPERFDSACIVLGSEGFTSGQHSWEVQVGDNQHWVLGVASKSVQRKGHLRSLSGLWTMCLHQGSYKTFSPHNPVLILPEQTQFQTIRVCLDLDRGHLRFYGSNELIHSFKREVESFPSVEGETRGWQPAAPLADEFQDVLTLGTVGGLQQKQEQTGVKE